MTTDSFTVRVPHPLYERLEELVEALAETISLVDAPLPAEVEDLIGSLDAKSDDDLRQLAHASHLSPAAATHLEELNLKCQREGLTGDEQQMVEVLAHQYERAMVVRAEVLVRLKERGQDITPLLNSATA